MDYNTTLVDRVEDLNEEVKTLALNMAIYLARVKKESNPINRMEPDFIKLVNSTVKVVQELTTVIDAARERGVNKEDKNPTYKTTEQLETRLNSILIQCHDILEVLNQEEIPKEEI